MAACLELYRRMGPQPGECVLKRVFFVVPRRWDQSIGSPGQALFVLKTRPIPVLLSDQVLHVVDESYLNTREGQTERGGI